MDSGNQFEQLFLLEVLIDKIVLNDVPPDTPIRVRVKFIEFPCFEITQQDFRKSDPPDGQGNFNSGKSFLFPMVPLELIRHLQRHPLAVTVFKVSEDAPLLPEIVGQTRVRLSEGMAEAVHSAMGCRCDGELPISHTITDTYSLRNLGEEVGTVELFVRLSCFGQSIVTQFQLMGEKKAFLFKNSKADTAFNCRKATGKEPGEVEDPTKYDILPVAPFLTSDDNTFDLYSPTGDAEDATVAWRKPEPKPAPCPPCDARGSPPPPACLPCQAPPAPPIRYDTTGALSPAYRGAPYVDPRPVYPTPEPTNPPVRYDTTGALSPAAVTDRMSLSSRGSSFQCPVCRTTRPPDPQTNSCSVCGTCCPFYGNPPPPQPQWTPPPRNSTPLCPTPCSCACGDSPDPCEYGARPSIPYDTTPPIRYDTTGALSPAYMGAADASCCVPGCNTNGADTPNNTPIRYDTTGALSPAYMGRTDAPNSTPVRYDTTGALSPASNSTPVRYDTTGALSPAFMGAPDASSCVPGCNPNGGDSSNNTPVRYDTTGALSPAFMGQAEPWYPDPTNPPIRYDTTGALSPAFMGWPEPPTGPPQPSPLCKCGDGGSMGQGDGLSDGMISELFTTIPVCKTGSTPAVMQPGGAGGARRPKKVASRAKTGKPKKKRSKWTHKWGLQYPGIKYGHRHCVIALPHVPAFMGWLWTKPSIGHKYVKGWRPGAVGPTISKIMNDHRAALGQPPLGVKAKSKWKGGRGGGHGSRKAGPQPPTLHVHRKEGAYYISMHPLDLGPDSVNVPLQFKIPKRQREEGDEEGDEDGEYSTSSSEESELEIEFLAPGAFEERVLPPEFKNHGTQYRPEDCPLPPVPPSMTALAKGGKGGKGGKGKGKGKGKK